MSEPVLPRVPIRSPAEMAMLLFFPGFAIGAVPVLFALLVGPALLDLAPDERDGLWRLAIWMFVVGAAMLLVLSVYTAQRLRPLYRALGRRAQTPDDAPPPSQALVRDAFDVPDRSMWSIAALVGFLVLLDAGGIAPLSGSSGPRRIAIDLFCFAVGCAALQPTILAWRRALWSWVGALRPSDIASGMGDRVVRRVIVAVAVPVAIVTAVATALLLSRANVSAAIVSAILGVATTFTCVLAARRLGRLAKRDLLGLTDRIQMLSELDPIRASGDTTRTRRARFRTAAAIQLAEVLDMLAMRFDSIAAQEDRAKRSVEEAQRLKTRFMASMSHDLRSPLNSIRGFSELLLSGADGELNPAQHESVTLIHRSGDDLLRLLGNILDMARLEAGRLELVREWTPAVEIVTEAVRRGRQLVAGRELDIVAEVQPGLPPVFVDPARIVQAIVGILGHAALAVERGAIRLRAVVAHGPPGPSQYVRVDVIDTGAPLRDEDRARIFEAFRALVSPSGRRIAGLGLGISLARLLVLEHGGDVWCETGRSEGTVFTVAIPLDRGPR